MKFTTLLFLLVVYAQIAVSQNYTISGYVEDSKTGERIIGAYVMDSISKKSTTTNNYGFFSLKNSTKNAVLFCRFVGYIPEKQTLNLSADTSIVLKLTIGNQLKEVVIQDSKYAHDINSPLGATIISTKDLLLIPALGEPDLLKSIQSQPGIKGGIEGSSGIYVRGGGGGENLIMLDDVPMYNVSHLYGFFSAFNSSAVKDIKLVKGCFPAQYGGRVSSVIDVRSLDGNNQSIKGEAAISLVSSRFTLEGPLINDKTTFMISGRRSYFDLFNKISNILPDYYFYDLNAKITHTFSGKDRLFLSFYKGKDNINESSSSSEVNGTTETFTEKKTTTSGWGNLIGSLRWNHIFGNSLFSNTTFSYSNYDFFTQDDYTSTDVKTDPKETIKRNYTSKYTSTITDYILKNDFDYTISDKQKLKFGLGVTFHTFNPGKQTYSMNDELLKEKADTIYSNSIIHASEPFFYIEHELKVGEQITINTGLRLSSFVSENKTKGINPEPRISANYTITPQLALKGGYSRMVQYVHLLSCYGLNMPTDIWIPALSGLKPLKSDQVNIGMSYNMNDFVLFTVEIYQKWLYNTTDYKNGASLTTDFVPWYEKTTQGKGNARGLEVSIEKQWGKLKGSINYTLSKSDRTYSELNNGQSFPFMYDRKHDFNISANYQISEKWNISALWIYGSGYPVSLPVEKYLPALGIYNSDYGGEVDYYPSTNNYRLPAYHRLDLGIHYKFQNRWGSHGLSFDVFNAYNHKNPIYMYYSGYRIKVINYAYLLPIIPSITYTFRF